MMKREAKAPAFQLYAGDFLTDVMDWTDEEVGAHMRLLCWSWVNRRGIPRDTQRLSRIASTAVKCWPTIGVKWVEGPDETWINDRLERTRADSDAFRSRQKVKSDLAVSARKGKPAKKKRSTLPVGSSNGQPLDVSNDSPTGVPVGYPLEGEGEVKSELKGKERANVAPSYPEDFPPSMRTPAALSAWNDWEASRREKKKPITTTARRLQLADCAEWGVDRAIAALLHSAKNNYQGLFLPNTMAAPTATEKSSATIMDRGTRPTSIREHMRVASKPAQPDSDAA